MTEKGLEHVIYVLTECRTKMMHKPEPMAMERIQEAITLCREAIARKRDANQQQK